MSKQREYRYVGPSEIRDNLPEKSQRVLIQSRADVINWIKGTNQQPEHDDLIVATFIIDTSGQLWINDRRSEHVLCAAGKNVLSAGEMAFEVAQNHVEVIEVTNQSTGYCPEPESWRAVKQALDAVAIPHPPDFTMKFIFRLCETCGTKNIVKDMWFECAVCQAPLNEQWNF